MADRVPAWERGLSHHLLLLSVVLVVVVGPMDGSRSFVFYLLLLWDKLFLTPTSEAFLVQSLKVYKAITMFPWKNKLAYQLIVRRYLLYPSI